MHWKVLRSPWPRNNKERWRKNIGYFPTQPNIIILFGKSWEKMQFVIRGGRNINEDDDFMLWNLKETGFIKKTSLSYNNFEKPDKLYSGSFSLC